MNQERLLQVLVEPLISEKSTNVGDQANQYVFKVARDATKPEIRQAVESLFDVKVVDVTTANIKGKRKRFGRLSGRRSDVRKAYVRLAAGQELDFTGGAE
jgi:large subunit ribosomal protein L23